VRRRALLLPALLLGACAPQNRRTYAAGIAPPKASASVAAAPAHDVKVGEVRTTHVPGGTPLRESPAALARLVELLPRGTRVRVLGVEGSWAGVSVEGAATRGWVRGNDLVEQRASAGSELTVPSGRFGGSPVDTVPVRPLSEDAFFRGREALVPWLEFVAPHAASRGKTITTTARLPQAEEQVYREAVASGRRDVRSLFVHGVAYRVSCPPARAAQVLCDPEVEKTSFAAQEGSDLGPAARGEGRRMSFGLLDMGEKPFVYDFRFSVEATRVTRPGGVFLVRTEMIAEPAPERVSLVAGVAVCAPDGDGTRVSEVIAIGSPVSTPFFLKGKARSAVDRILSQRATRLAAAMSAR
jgi:hypothetical protein